MRNCSVSAAAYKNNKKKYNEINSRLQEKIYKIEDKIKQICG